MAQIVKNLRIIQETQVRSLSWEDPMEKGMATNYSILAWRIPWTKKIYKWPRWSTSLILREM